MQSNAVTTTTKYCTLLAVSCKNFSLTRNCGILSIRLLVNESPQRGVERDLGRTVAEMAVDEKILDENVEQADVDLAVVRRHLSPSGPGPFP